jgi:predicted Zn-dependent protease
MSLPETYLETRHHELRKTRMSMVDGNLTGNLRSVQAGVSARAYRDGYWGFASAPADDAGVQLRVQQLAADNARAMAGFGVRAGLALPGAHYRGEQALHGGVPLTAAECAERMAELHAHCMARFPGLRSTRVMVTDEHHVKRLQTEGGGQSLARIQRAAIYVVLVGEDDQGTPIELGEVLSGIGSLADVDWSLATLAPKLDVLHGHLQAKRHAVPARGGEQTVVLAPDLAGMLAHEAMGHPCEADAVLSGAVTADLRDRRVASNLITMVDLAHHWNGAELMCPVYVDDEGTPAQDVTMIDQGILRQFMHSRETAARLGLSAQRQRTRLRPGRRAAGAHAQHRHPAWPQHAGRPDRRRRRRLPAAGHQQRPGRRDHRVHVRREPGVRNPQGQAGRRRARHHAVGQRAEGAAERRRRGQRHEVDLQRLLRQEAADGGVGRRPVAACTRPPGRRMTMAFATDTLAQQVLAALRARGFDHAQVTVSDTRRCELNLAHNEPSLLRSNEARKLSATGIVSGRRASAEGSDLSADGMALLVDELWTSAGSAPPDAANAVSAGQQLRVAKGPREADPTALAAALRTLLDWRTAHTPTMMIEEATAAHVHHRSHTVTSGGSAIDCDLGWCEMTVFGLARDGSQTSSFNYAGGSADALTEVPARFGIERMMRELTQQVHTETLAERFVGDVVLAPGAVSDLLSWLMDQLRDGPLIDGSSVYREQVGQRIASPLLTLEEPLRRTRLRAAVGRRLRHPGDHAAGRWPADAAVPQPVRQPQDRRGTQARGR